jgi:hypothetical protein
MDEIMKIKLEMMRLDWDIEERDIVVRQSKNLRYKMDIFIYGILRHYHKWLIPQPN